MERRGMLGAALAAPVALAAPALAQTQNPEIRWRCASSFPKNLDILYGGSEYLAKRVAQMTDNRFQIRTFAAGEIVPALQVLDGLQTGTIECGQTASLYYVGKDPTFAAFTAIPFGMNMRQMSAWLRHGGGNEIATGRSVSTKLLTYTQSSGGGICEARRRRNPSTIVSLPSPSGPEA